MRVSSLNYNAMPTKSFGKFIKVSNSQRDFSDNTVDYLYLNTDNIESVRIKKTEGKKEPKEITLVANSGREYQLREPKENFKSIDDVIKLLNN